ncbi:MAG: hydrogenase maturation protease [Pseudomonadota bacterium]
MSQAPQRVIGVGSPFGDDAAGWRVIEHLQGRVLPGVELVRLDRPGAGLISWLESADHVVVIDALRSGAEAGTVRRLEPGALAGLPDGPSSHGLGMANALQLAGAIGALPPRLDIYAIELGTVDGEGLSPAVERAALDLADRLASLLAPKGSAEKNPSLDFFSAACREVNSRQHP